LLKTHNALEIILTKKDDLLIHFLDIVLAKNRSAYCTDWYK